MEILDRTERLLLATLLGSNVVLSGRALARMTGTSQSTAQRALVRLRDAGLVLIDVAPPSLLYRANHDHLAIPALTELLALRERLRDRAAAQIGGWSVPPMSAVLYGSVARDESGPGSDVDVLLVRPTRVRTDDPQWESQVSQLSELLTRWTGRQASVIEITSSEARRGFAAGEPYLVAAAGEGLTLSGRPLAEFGRRAG